VKEYDIYVPLTYNDGSRIERHKKDHICELLVRHFNGVTFFPQPNYGFWKMGNVLFRDKIVVFRVVTGRVRFARRFLKKLKQYLQRELRQEQILIVEKDASVL
jgi:hypothetical protein